MTSNKKHTTAERLFSVSVIQVSLSKHLDGWAEFYGGFMFVSFPDGSKISIEQVKALFEFFEKMGFKNVLIDKFSPDVDAHLDEVRFIGKRD